MTAFPLSATEVTSFAQLAAQEAINRLNDAERDIAEAEAVREEEQARADAVVLDRIEIRDQGDEFQSILTNQAGNQGLFDQAGQGFGDLFGATLEAQDGFALSALALGTTNELSTLNNPFETLTFAAEPIGAAFNPQAGSAPVGEDIAFTDPDPTATQGTLQGELNALADVQTTLDNDEATSGFEDLTLEEQRQVLENQDASLALGPSGLTDADLEEESTELEQDQARREIENQNQQFSGDRLGLTLALFQSLA
jgi:flagellin-like hook-associated protein FlgL